MGRGPERGDQRILIAIFVQRNTLDIPHIYD